MNIHHTCRNAGHRWGRRSYFTERDFIRRCQRAGCGRFLVRLLGRVWTYDQDPVTGGPINIVYTATPAGEHP